MSEPIFKDYEGCCEYYFKWILVGSHPCHEDFVYMYSDYEDCYDDYLEYLDDGFNVAIYRRLSHGYND